MIKKKKSLQFLFEKNNENSFENADAFTDVQIAMSNSNANKKNKKFDNDRFYMNKADIECYNCHEKNHIFRHCFKSKQKDSKKNKNRST